MRRLPVSMSCCNYQRSDGLAIHKRPKFNFRQTNYRYAPYTNARDNYVACISVTRIRIPNARISVTKNRMFSARISVARIHISIARISAADFVFINGIRDDTVVIINECTSGVANVCSKMVPRRVIKDVTSKDGVLVLTGYAIRLAVDRGRLCIEDGVGSERRSARFSRVGSGIKRLVVLGHSGIVSFEALRWLNDIGAAFVVTDSDGDLICAAGPFGLDDARLRRAQAMAPSNGVGLQIARGFIEQKLKGQIAVLEWFDEVSGLKLFDVKLAWAKLDRAASIDELRTLEGQGARAYWSIWESLPVRFQKRDSERVPEHWLSFGGRSSPLSRPSPRRRKSCECPFELSIRNCRGRDTDCLYCCGARSSYRNNARRSACP